MISQKVSAGTRLGIMILDHFIMTIIAIIFFAFGVVSNFSNEFSVSHDLKSEDPIFNIYIGLIGLAIYFCKDSFNGQSIAKRIFKLQLVDNASGLVASPLKCFVRNIFCVLWPIEVIVALINPNRRIGDRVAGTKLIPFDLNLERPKPNYKQIVMSLGLAYGIMLLIMFPFNSEEFKLESQKMNLVESSFNVKESKAVEQLFADSLGKYLTADVRVYDRIQNEDLKYVSIILQLKENYMEDDEDFERLKSATVPLILTFFPEKTFVRSNSVCL